MVRNRVLWREKKKYKTFTWNAQNESKRAIIASTNTSTKKTLHGAQIRDAMQNLI
jgi:hypothetical protein